MNRFLKSFVCYHSFCMSANFFLTFDISRITIFFEEVETFYDK